MRRGLLFYRSESGAAASEMALVTPLLLVLIFGAVELGSYFWSQHIIVKAVRDGARYAARQSMSNFSGCSGTPGGTVAANTRNIVRTGRLSGGTARIPWPATNDGTYGISITVSCATAASDGTADQNMMGIYEGLANGARIVTVTANVAYQPVSAGLGFNASGLKIGATSQAAVTGI
jgi:hypothetical protein